MKTLITSALIADGGGTPLFRADLLTQDDKILAIAGGLACEDARRIDASGLVVCPGFIDAHRHIDYAIATPGYGQAELTQGITTAIAGPCGFSAAPTGGYADQIIRRNLPILGDAPDWGALSFPDYLDRLTSLPLPLNLAAQVGAGTLRLATVGAERAHLPVNARDQGRMAALLREALEAGAAGLSMGLMYSPECDAPHSELLLMANELAKFKRPLTVHLRGEGINLAESVREMLELQRQSGIALHISHFKAAGKSAWGAPLERAMRAMERAVQSGCDVSCDVYPYSAGSTSIRTLLPPDWQRLPDGALWSALSDPEERARLKAELRCEHPDWDNILCSTGWGAVRLSGARNPSVIGKTVEQIASERGQDPQDTGLDLIHEQPDATMVYHTMSDENVRRILKWPLTSIISDAILGGQQPHPRAYGAFPRVLARCVRETGALTLPEAVHKMTRKPALRYGLKQKGLLAPGMDADLVAFDPEKIADAATYEHPRKPPVGVEYVMLNGELQGADQKGGGKLIRIGR